MASLSRAQIAQGTRSEKELAIASLRHEAELLFRLDGVPVYVGDLALYTQDFGSMFNSVEMVGIIMDFRYDEEAQKHVVHFLAGGEVMRIMRGDISLL